jgi:hypothetical protein
MKIIKPIATFKKEINTGNLEEGLLQKWEYVSLILPIN